MCGGAAPDHHGHSLGVQEEFGWSQTLDHAAKEDHGSMDGQAPQCSEEAGRGRRLGAEKTFRFWLVERKQVPTGFTTAIVGMR